METTIIVRGILKADGTLEVPQPLALPPGPVQITIQPLPASPVRHEDWWQYLQRARAELEARGHPFRTQEEIEAERAAFRSGDEHIEDVYRRIEAEHRRGGG